MEKKIRNRPTKEKENEFLSALAIECNYSDIESVRNIYFSLLRLITKELRSKERINLPQFGEFSLFEKSGTLLCKTTGQRVKFGPVKMVKFKPFWRLKEYFKQK